jgi:hypothetical protein
MIRLLAALSLIPFASGQTLTLETARSVRALSFDGDVVLSDASSGQVSVWRPGSGWIDIPGPTVVGRDLSSDGSVVLAGSASTGGFVWERGAGWSPIAGPGIRRPLWLSGDGNRVTATTDADPFSGDAYVWDRSTGSIDVLEVPVGASLAVPAAMDEDGDVIAGYVVSGMQQRAAVWSSTGAVTPIDPIAGGPWSQAFGVSSTGEWVVGTRAGREPFRWSAATGVQLLPTIGTPGPLLFHSANFVSDDGTVVAGHRADTRPLSLESTAYVIVQGGAPERFRDFVLARGGPDLGPAVTIRGMSRDGARFVVEAGSSSYWVDVDPVVSVAVCSPAVANSTGVPARRAALGSSEANDRFLLLRVASLPSGTAVLPIVSMTQAVIPMPGGSSGTLCLGGTIGRITVGAADASGAYELEVDTAALPVGGGTVTVGPGETWTFQAWYRDVGTSNFTDAAEVTFR